MYIQPATFARHVFVESEAIYLGTFLVNSKKTYALPTYTQLIFLVIFIFFLIFLATTHAFFFLSLHHDIIVI